MKEFKALIVLIIFILPFTAQGAREKEKSTLQLSTVGTITTGSEPVLKIWDKRANDFPQNGNTHSEFEVEDVRVNVVLRFDDYDFGSLFEGTISVTYDIDVTNQNGTRATKSGETIEITFDNNGTAGSFSGFEDKVINSYYGQYRGKITITNIQAVDASSSSITIPDFVYLDLEVETERYYKLDVTKALAIQCGTTSVSTDNHFELAWEFTPGAESYDVEWLYYDITSDGILAGLSTHYFDFKGATRVNTSKQFLKIPMNFPEGYLIYRVRPVGKAKINGLWNDRVEGKWSVDPGIESLDDALTAGYAVKYAGLDLHHNWIYNVNYAEEGKRKELMKYYDGTSRERQTITSVNSSGHVLVADKIYDQQGRPAIDVVPFPLTSKGVRYYTKSNGDPLTGNFQREDFDDDTHFDKLYPYRGANPPGYVGPVGVTGGQFEAEKYFSSDNSTSDDFVDYSPISGNFPYYQKVYKNDGTNRIVAESQLGPEHSTLNGKHGIEYVYTSTNQKELDRLFGNEAGRAEHYSKMYIKDANGQYTVNYMDNQDRIIASALYGQKPDNLLEVDGKGGIPNLTVDILENNNKRIDKETISTYTFFQPSETPVNFTFEYNLETVEHCETCASTCYDCEYTLVIDMYDEWGRHVKYCDVYTSFPSVCQDLTMPYDFLPYNLHIEEHYSYISSAPIKTKTIQVQLDKGSYKITKSLKVTKGSPEKYSEQFYDYLITNRESNNCIDWNPLGLEAKPCPDDSDCESYCENLYVVSGTGINRVFHDDDGNTYTPVLNTGQTAIIDFLDDNNNSCSGEPCELDGTATYPENVLDLIKDCEPDCEDNELPTIPQFDICDVRLAIMKRHMSPGGQYFDNEEFKYDRDEHNKVLFNSATGDPVVSSSYSGKENDWLINNIQSTPTSLHAQFSGYEKWSDLRQNWQDSYADILVEYHPEYCAYQYFCDLDIPCRAELGSSATLSLEDYHSYIEDMDFNNTHAYGVTGTAFNFMNPSGISGPSGLTGTTGKILYRPYTSPTVTTYKADPYLTFCTAFPTDKEGTIDEWLDEFIPEIIDPSSSNTVNSAMSIWYLLDDPDLDDLYDGVSGPTGTGVVHSDIRDVFQVLHGDGQDPGIIGTNPGQITKYEFFRSVYKFYREYLMYEDFVKYYNCNTNDLDYIPPAPSGPTGYSAWDDDGDYDGILDNSYYQLVFNKNYNFDLFGGLHGVSGITGVTGITGALNITSSISSATYDPPCETNCELAADDWIAQYTKDLCFNSFTTVQLDEVKDDLIQVCMLGCDVSDGYLGNSDGNGLTSGGTIDVDYVESAHNAGVYFYNFNDVRDYYESGCSTIVVHPPPSLSTEFECNYEQLLHFADSLASVSTENPTLVQCTTIANACSTEFGVTVSAAEVSSWYDFFQSGDGDISATFPIELRCQGCMCDNLVSWIAINGFSGTGDYAAIYEEYYDDTYDPGTDYNAANEIWTVKYPACTNSVAWSPTNIPAATDHPESSYYLVSNSADFRDAPDFILCEDGVVGPVDINQFYKDRCEDLQDSIHAQNLLINYLIQANHLKKRIYCKLLFNLLRRHRK